MKLKLTDKAVQAAQALPGERVELWDTQTPGLCLRVSGGKKVWVYRYRTDDGRQPRLTMGPYSPAAGLAWARERADRLRIEVRDGGDPAGAKKRARSVAKAQPLKTFDDLADAYLTACETGAWKPKNKKKRTSTVDGERGVLKRHVRPALGDLRLEEISKSTVKAFLLAMIARGIGAQTNKAHALTRQCFAYAIAEERVTTNPAVFSFLAEQKPRARVLKDAELKSLWGGLQAPGALTVHKEGKKPTPVRVSRPMAIAIELLALLAQRRAEVIGMRSDELNLDQATWLIPAERMKGNRDHLVPLPPRAVVLIMEALRLADDLAALRVKKDPALAASTPNWTCAFPSPRNLSKAIRPDSVTHAMAALTEALKIKGAAPHDLRRTVSTVMTSERLGIAPFIRSKVLAHASDAGGGSAVSMIHYDANEYVAEKRRALEA